MKYTEMKRNEHLINEEIKINLIKLVGDNIDNKTCDFNIALDLAKSMGLDLVLMNNNSNVCRIMDYQKFIYQKNKIKKQKTIPLKEIRLTPNIAKNDLNVKVKQITEFLIKKHRVKVIMQFKGRETNFSLDGERILLQIVVDVEEFGIAESLPKLDGKKMEIQLRPK